MMCQLLVLLFLSLAVSVSGQADGQVTVHQFRQGENVTISTPGDTEDGCKFVFQVGADIVRLEQRRQIGS